MYVRPHDRFADSNPVLRSKLSEDPVQVRGFEFLDPVSCK